MIRQRNNFPNRATLAAGLAKRVAMALSSTITRAGQATLAVSGGTTPKLFFEELSQAEVTWEKVTITLVDERQVPEEHPRSNAGLVKSLLMRHRASRAKFVPLFKNTAEAAALKLDCVVLGMGEDGHTASFFPHGDNLAKAIKSDLPCGLITMEAPGASEPRLTFTLPSLLAATYLFLHIEGMSKKRVLEKAEAGTDPMTMPIRALLQAKKPIDLYWCP